MRASFREMNRRFEIHGLVNHPGQLIDIIASRVRRPVAFVHHYGSHRAINSFGHSESLTRTSDQYSGLVTGLGLKRDKSNEPLPF